MHGVCLPACGYVSACLLFLETTGGCGGPWNWSCRGLEVTMMSTVPGPSAVSGSAFILVFLSFLLLDWYWLELLDGLSLVLFACFCLDGVGCSVFMFPRSLSSLFTGKTDRGLLFPHSALYLCHFHLTFALGFHIC